MKFETYKITDVFFDLDHTLWDFEKNSELTYQRIFAKHNLSVDLGDFLAVYVPNNLKLWGLYQEDKITKDALRYRRLKLTFDELGLKMPEQLIHLLADEYIKYLSTFNHLFQDSIEILDYLYPKYNLHIITNGFAEVQQGKLENSGIDRYFKVVMNSEKAGVKKPNPLIFEKALSEAQATAKSSVMIGDDYQADILGAQKVGMHTLHYNPVTNPLSDKSFKINALRQIKNYL